MTRGRAIRRYVAGAVAVGAIGVLLGCASTGTTPGGDQSSSGSGSGESSGSSSTSSGGSSSGVSSSGSGSGHGSSSGSAQGSSSGGADSGTPPPQVDSGSDATTGDGSQCGPCGASTPICDQGTCKACTTTAGCTSDTPVCDTGANGGTGQCIQVQVLAFNTVDAQQQDRAHAAYVRHANVWFPQQAIEQKFFTYTSSTDWTQLATITPAPGRVVMFLDNFPSGSAQQMGFQTYMENGGAWMGCHVSGYNDNMGGYEWRWYFETFLGGSYFVSNTWLPTPANLDVDDPSHPFSKGLGTMFTSATSEWYSWTVDLRTLPNIDILLSVDPSSFPLGTDPNQSWTSGYYPIAWTNKNYKMLYVNMGHEAMDYAADTATSSSFDSPTQDIMYMNAFRWLGGAQL